MREGDEFARKNGCAEWMAEKAAEEGGHWLGLYVHS
jgi:hypothetical protein